MARYAIAVNAHQGYYSFKLGTEEFPYRELRRAIKFLRTEETLLGWHPWRYCIRTDRGYFFVTGLAEPREFGDG